MRDIKFQFGGLGTEIAPATFGPENLRRLGASTENASRIERLRETGPAISWMRAVGDLRTDGMLADLVRQGLPQKTADDLRARRESMGGADYHAAILQLRWEMMHE